MHQQFRLVRFVPLLALSLILVAGCDSDPDEGDGDTGILDNLTCEGTSVAIASFFNSAPLTWEACETVEDCSAIIPRVTCVGTDTVIEECPVAISLSAADEVDEAFDELAKQICRALPESCTNTATCAPVILKCTNEQCVFELDQDI